MIERLIIDFFNAIENEESITSKHGKAVFFIEELLERKNNKFSYIEKKKAIRLQEKYIEKKENVNAKTDPFLRDVMAQYLNYQDYEAYKASFISITQNNPSNPHTIKWYQKRINKLVIASSILFSLLCSFLMYQISSTHTTTCIVWKDNHFEKTSCHTPNAIDNEIYAINIKRFRKIKVIKGKKGKKNNHLASVYNCLGINANEQKEHKEAIKWYKLAIEATNDTPKKLRYMSNMAVNYKELKKYEHSIDLYRRIMRDAYYDSLPLYSKGKIIDNYAFIKFLGGKKVEKKEFLRAQEIKRKSKDNQGLIANYSHLSDYYKVKNRKKALRYAFEMYALSKKIKAPKDRVEAIDKILGLAQGDNIKEYALERAYLSDSIQLAKKRSRNKFVKVIYNYEEEKKLKLAARADLAETKLLAEQQKKEKLILLFVGIFSVLGFIVYFFYKRAKTRKEKAEEVYKTETRLAKKIHDELASDVYHVMNKIQNRKVSNEELLDDLESIYYQTRDISHENSPIITGDSFENFLKQLFLDFTTNGCKILSKDLFKIEANTLSKEQQIVLYRLLRELLVNMKKHSKATLVVITFFKLKNSIKVQYKDNGIGAKEAVIKNGLQNMETRINSIGGSIIFETEEEKGFKSVFQFKK